MPRYSENSIRLEQYISDLYRINKVIFITFIKFNAAQSCKKAIGAAMMDSAFITPEGVMAKRNVPTEAMKLIAQVNNMCLILNLPFILFAI